MNREKLPNFSNVLFSGKEVNGKLGTYVGCSKNVLKMCFNFIKIVFTGTGRYFRKEKDPDLRFIVAQVSRS